MTVTYFCDLPVVSAAYPNRHTLESAVLFHICSDSQLYLFNHLSASLSLPVGVTRQESKLSSQRGEVAGLATTTMPLQYAVTSEETVKVEVDQEFCKGEQGEQEELKQDPQCNIKLYLYSPFVS